MTRRTALHATTLLPLAAVKGTAANSAVSVGLLGCGNRGTYLGQLVAEHTTARLVALCDRKPEAIAQAKNKIGRTEVTAYADMDRMLAAKLDAVVIATPVFLHADHFTKAVTAVKHVYLEKPAAPDVEGCRRIEKAAAGLESGRELTLGFQRRHGEIYNAAYEFLKSGKIGNVRMLHARFLKSSSGENAQAVIPEPKSLDDQIRHWYHWRKLCGDLVVENNCHLIDVMNWFAGARPDAASGEGGRKVRVSGDVRDFGTVIYQYPNSVQGTLTGMTIGAPFFRDVKEEYYGSTGWLETSELGWRYKLSRTETFDQRAPRNPSVDSVKSFVERIQAGKARNTIARGVESSLTAILGRLAMDLRRPVSWNEMLASNGWPA